MIMNACLHKNGTVISGFLTGFIGVWKGAGMVESKALHKGRCDTIQSCNNG